MGIATQLLQRANLVMVGSETTQKATCDGTITADGVRTQRGSDGVDRSPEDFGQGVREWASLTHHGCSGKVGRTCCFTAVSYTHLRAHETGRNLVCRLLLEKKKT